MTEENVSPEKDKNETEQAPDLGQFKTVDDLLKSYKEIQGAFTRVSQSNKEYEQRMAELEERLSVLSEQQKAPVANTNKSFDESWMENPEMTIDQRVEMKLNMARIEDVLAEEDAKNPEEFQDRYQWADMLAKNPQYAALSRTPAGVRKLFQMGDKLRKEQLIKSSKKALEHIFGEDLDEDKLAKVRELVTGKKKSTNTNDAYMPDVSTSTKSAADSESKPGKQARLSEKVAKGDVDGVLSEMFQNILAE